MRSGSDINLTCLVVQSPEPPSFIYWYRNDNVINYSSRGGINVLTEKQTKTSRLLISRAQPPDSGNYTCSPSSSEPASVIVHVLNGNLSRYYNIYFTLYCRISEKSGRQCESRAKALQWPRKCRPVICHRDERAQNFVANWKNHSHLCNHQIEYASCSVFNVVLDSSSLLQ